MDHDVALLADRLEQCLGNFLLSLMYLGQGPVMRHGYVQVDVMVSPRAQCPQLVWIDPAGFLDGIEPFGGSVIPFFLT